MDRPTKWTRTNLFLLITSVFQCNGVSLRQQLQHIAESQAESQGIAKDVLSRRSFYNYDPKELTSILGAPDMPSHLPEAEPILPGHTLLKPALGMLKSSIKFPHRDLEDGSGVYGNFENIGIKYDSRNERVLYSGFRRMPSGGIIINADPELVSNNQTPLYPNDNKAPVTKKRSKDRIYLKRIFESKLPTNAYKNGDFRRNILMNLNVKSLVGKVKNTLNNIWRNGVNFSKGKNILRSNTEESDLSQEAQGINTIINDTNDSEKLNGIMNISDTEKYNDLDNIQDAGKYNGVKNFQKIFNHVVIDQAAPDYSDIFPPKNLDHSRQWWFFNQVDLQRPLQTI